MVLLNSQAVPEILDSTDVFAPASQVVKTRSGAVA
jgi:hypothetical protein